MLTKRILLTLLSAVALGHQAQSAAPRVVVFTFTDEATQSPSTGFESVQAAPLAADSTNTSPRTAAAMTELLTGTRSEKDVRAKYTAVNFDTPKFRNAARLRREYEWTPSRLRRAATLSAACLWGAFGAAFGSIEITNLLVNAKWATQEAGQNGKTPKTPFDRFIESAYKSAPTASAHNQYERAKNSYFAGMPWNKRPQSREDRESFDKSLLESSAIDTPLKKLLLYAGPTALSLIISLIPRALRSVASAQKQVEAAVAAYLQGDAEAPDDELEAACAAFKRAKIAQRTTNLLLAGTGVLALFCAIHAGTIEQARTTCKKLGMNSSVSEPSLTQEEGSETPPMDV